MLPSKTIPLGARLTDHQLRKTSKHRPKKKQRVVEEAETSSSASVPNTTSVSEVCQSPCWCAGAYSVSQHHAAAKSKKKSAIHYFFEPVQFDAKGNKIPGEPGDKHYRCLHGSHKVITILGTSRSNLTSAQSPLCFDCLLADELSTALVNHLKLHFPAMHCLYTILHGHTQPPTDEEIEIASGKRKLDMKATTDYLKKLEIASKNIVQAFQRQATQAAVGFMFFLVSMF